MMNLGIEWYYAVWPWIGLGGGVALLFLLFGTKLLQFDKSISRWKDFSWIGWLGATLYLLHNTEEYGITIFGQLHAFPATMQAMLGTQPPESFFAAVNISMFWFGLPLAAYLSRKHPMMAMGAAGVLIVNALSHIAPFAMGIGYTAGSLTAIVLFLPYAIFVFATCYRKNKFGIKVLIVSLCIGILSHIVLLGTIIMFANGMVNEAVLVILQAANAALYLVLLFIFDKAFKNHGLKQQSA